jgi:hypothetical protein
MVGKFSSLDVLFYGDISEDYRNDEQEGSYGQNKEVYKWYMQRLGG